MIIAFFGGFIFLLCMYFKNDKKKIVIKFEISIIDQLVYMLILYAFILAWFIIEIGITQKVISSISAVENSFARIFCYLLDNGLLLLFSLPFISFIFGKLLEAYNLDLSSAYNENIFKIYFSLIVITICGVFIYLNINDGGDSEELTKYIYNRVVFWLFSVISTWFGIGFACEGRVQVQKKNIELSKKKNRMSKHDKFCYFFPVIAVYLVVTSILVLSLAKIEFFVTIIIYGSLVEGGAFWGTIVIVAIELYKYPSRRRSEKSLAKNISKINSIEKVSGTFQSIKYDLVNSKDCKQIILYSREIEWKGHEEEIQEKYKDFVYRKDLQSFSYEDCRELVINRIEEEKEFIKYGFEFCKKEREKQLRNN